MCLWKRFSHVLGNLYFLTQTEYFALWPFLASFKVLSSFQLSLFFLQPFFASNNFNVFVERFLHVLRNFIL